MSNTQTLIALGQIHPAAVAANALYVVVHLCQLVALAITWMRFWRGGSRVSQASSDTPSNTAPQKMASIESPRSREGRTAGGSQRKSSSKGARDDVMRFRLMLTNGMALAVTPRMVDAYALYFERWFLFNIVCFYIFCMFGAVWFLHLVKQYMKAFYVAERGLVVPPAAEKIYRAFAVLFICILSTWTIGLSFTEHLAFVFGNYVGSVVAIGAMGAAIHYSSRNIYRRVEQLTKSSPSANSKIERDRAERLAKFKKFAKSSVGSSVQIVVTNLVCAGIFFPRGDVVRLSDLELWKVVFLDVQLTLLTQGMLGFVQYVQWLPKPKTSIDDEELRVQMTTRNTILPSRSSGRLPSRGGSDQPDGRSAASTPTIENQSMLKNVVVAPAPVVTDTESSTTKSRLLAPKPVVTDTDSRRPKSLLLAPEPVVTDTDSTTPELTPKSVLDAPVVNRADTLTPESVIAAPE